MVMKPGRDQIRQYLSGITNSYSQVFFSDSRFFAVILMLVTFIDFFAGISGLFSVLVTSSAAYWLGFDKERINKGIYGFNSLLVGLGLGIYFSPGILLFFILFIAALFTLFISVSLEGVIGKYALPYLSVSFIISIWIVTLATREFTALGISERGIYSLNDLYIIGGNTLVKIYEWGNNINLPHSLKTYFISLGAIFFQFNVISGVFIAIGLLYYSRIAFSLSLIGFYTAFIFYQIIGADITEISYSYIGFNFILTAIALGGFFIIPSRLSYLWTVLIIPLVVILVVSLNKIFVVFSLPIYSLPFNLIVLLFLYILKFRVRRNELLSEVIIQQNSPEKNLYSYQNYLTRFKYKAPVSLGLPFFGEWSVTQAHDGEHTHQGSWKHAWDFMILDEDGSIYGKDGDYAEDYYCYGKAIAAPADGIVEEIIDGIPDNIIGEANTKQNWGNTIIIRHTDYLFTKLSHLMPDSFTVKKGEKVTSGQIIGKCGNSGRSPYPHLHFQIQSTPFIGSATLDYPIGHYMVEKSNETELKFYAKPELDERVSNINRTPLLQKAFNFVPGKRFRWHLEGNNSFQEWEIKTTAYNQSYFECETTGSKAFFEEDEDLVIFTHFEGSRSSVLYFFYLAVFKVQKGYYQDLTLEDRYPINHVFSKKALFLHDFIAPFYKYLKASFSIDYSTIDNELSPSTIILKSAAKKYLGKRLIDSIDFEIQVNENGNMALSVLEDDNEILFICEK